MSEFEFVADVKKAGEPAPKRRVLVVEDDEYTNLLLCENLRNEGFDVISVPDGEAGVKAAIEQLPDLIMLDIMLPRLDGWEVCRKLREAGMATRGIPIVIVSVLSKERPSATESMGPITLFNKPFEVNALLDEVKRVIAAVTPAP